MLAHELLVHVVRRDLQLPGDYQIELIRHDVGTNWRQRFTTPRQQIGALEESIRHGGPFTGERVPVHRLTVALAGDTLSTATPRALSVASRIWNASNEQVGHLALMNLHPAGFTGTGELRTAVGKVTAGMPGYLVSSGRYFHYYGARLLDADAWLRFLAQFLMPCVLVSPRYVGHSLYRGFCALRLNAVPPHKPAVPWLIGGFSASRGGFAGCE